MTIVMINTTPCTEVIIKKEEKADKEQFAWCSIPDRRKPRPRNGVANGKVYVIYIYIYIHMCIIYVYIYIYVYMYNTYIYIYIYID